MLVLLCCLNGARQYPTNMIVLGIFTLGESLFLAVISAQYTAWSVCLATGTTVIVVGVLTLFACTTKIDFTGMGMYLYVSLMCLSLFGFIGIFFVVGTSYKMAQYYQLGYACIGCLIFSLYLVYDTQLIIGGQHKKFQFTVDEYVFAALNIYIDIVQLFLYILQMLGDR